MNIFRKETRFVVRYGIWKYVIDLGRTANDLAFTTEGACVVKKLVSKERGSTLEIATFRPKSYCKSLIEIRNACTNPWCIYQPAVRCVVGKPNLNFQEEPLGIQRSNYARERNTRF